MKLNFPMKLCLLVCVALRKSSQHFLGYGLGDAGRLGLGYGGSYGSGIVSQGLLSSKYGGLGKLGLLGGIGGLAYGIPIYKLHGAGGLGGGIVGGVEYGNDFGGIGEFGPDGGGGGGHYAFYDPEIEFHHGKQGGNRFPIAPVLGLFGGLGGIAHGTDFGRFSSGFGHFGGGGDDVDFELAGLGFGGGAGIGGYGGKFGHVGGAGRFGGRNFGGFGKRVGKFGGGFGKFGGFHHIKKYGGPHGRLGLIGGGIGGLAYGGPHFPFHPYPSGRHFGKYVRFEHDGGGYKGGFGGPGDFEFTGGFHDVDLEMLKIEHEIELQKPVFLELEFYSGEHEGSRGSGELF